MWTEDIQFVRARGFSERSLMLVPCRLVRREDIHSSWSHILGASREENSDLIVMDSTSMNPNVNKFKGLVFDTLPSPAGRLSRPPHVYVPQSDTVYI